MKLRTLLVGAVAGLVMTACGGGGSAEDATRSFAKAMADGDCEKALGMAIDDAKSNVEGSMDSGCEPYDSEIKKVECQEDGETATCTCEETRGVMGDMTFNYDLKKVEGEWKVSKYAKDMNMDLGGGDSAE
ncbi:hypothetical protein K6119_01365 [Paracrocinitomix mangrovi]|uniref:hypothetical protein n=1 Tax=Paracrocinitomix mangrovi TaxID=2862509 RepID=UPI001C8E54A5|nr:hypothetical protein [Paracrocinitomix mangrovi]UKN02165.1 hypothetical protein K6119_01365 [Paracrocinitomix mangrovi]